MGWLADEPLRVRGVGSVQDKAALGADGVGESVMNVGCRV